MPTHRTRLVLLGLAAILCSLEPGTAQRYDDGSGGSSPTCAFTYASASFPNVDGDGSMSAACDDGTPGDVGRSLGSDNVWQCGREESRDILIQGEPENYRMLEHLWKFSNVSPGHLSLQFEGHKATGTPPSGAEADDFIFLVRTVPLGAPCPLDVNSPVGYQKISLESNYATFIHGTEDASGAISLGQSSVASDFCVLAMSVKACPAVAPCPPFLQVDADDLQRDLLYMDRLAICTLPL